MNIKRDNILGITLIVVGVLIFLFNTNILSNDILLLVLAVAFLLGYYTKKNTGYLIIGVILLSLGIGELIDDYGIASIDLRGFLFTWFLGVAFLVLYFGKDTKGFLYLGCILPAVGTYFLLDEIYDGDVGWAFFLLLAISFFVIYAFEYTRTRVKWPLIPGTVLATISLLFFLNSEDLIKYDLWRFISYIWPTLIILAGVRILYNNFKYTR